MLKITRLNHAHHTIIKIEGKLLTPWLDEVRTACAEARRGAAKVHMDLDAVSFADNGGIELINELRGLGISVERCSNYLAELLRLETR